MKPDKSVEILIVEDNADDAELLLRSLKKLGLAEKAFLVRDGEEALNFMFSKDKYINNDISELKLVLLDLKLPKLDGFAVIKKVKSDISKKSIPIVVLTSSREKVDLVESYSLGANSYIIKPLDYAEFGVIVEKLCDYWLVLNNLPYTGGDYGPKA
jgi:CheY-like chemotaxis protein